MNVIELLEREQEKPEVPVLRSGDTVRVHVKVVEGTRERIQVFEGVVIATSGSVGPRASFTVRRVTHNVGVERRFLLHSPRIDRIEVVRHGEVRRAKLYYLREKKGKAARIRERRSPVGGAASTRTHDLAPAAGEVEREVEELELDTPAVELEGDEEDFGDEPDATAPQTPVAEAGEEPPAREPEVEPDPEADPEVGRVKEAVDA